MPTAHSGRRRIAAAAAGLIAAVSLAWTLAGSTHAHGVSPPPKPTITITKPKDGARIHDKSVVVAGTYQSEEDPDFIRINGIAIVPDRIHSHPGHGSFSDRVKLKKGRNKIAAKIILRDHVSDTDPIHVTSTYEKPLPHRLLFESNGKPLVRFAARTERNKVKKLSGFRVDKVPCVPLDLKDTIKVHHRHFSHAETLNIEEGVHVKVRGRFSANGKRAHGTVSVAGACTYAKHHWKAKGSPYR